MRATEEQAFNEDLLLQDDHAAAAEIFQQLVQVLEFPELQKKFKCYEKRAEGAKKVRRRVGLLAIILSAIAVYASFFKVYASFFELLSEDPQHPGTALSWMTVALGLFGAGFGLFGICNKKYKQRWLCNRLMSERLRQLHFQILISQIPAILAAVRDPVEQSRFVGVRRRLLATFCLHYENHLQAHLKTVLDDVVEEDCWLLDGKPEPLRDRSDPNLNIFLAAYRLLRIQHQLQYASYKLYADEKFLLRSATRQRDILRTVNLGAIFIVFIIHMTIAALIIAGRRPEMLVYFEGGVVTVAIAALIARAFEEGLQPAAEVERYTRYRAELTRLLRRYDETSEPEEKTGIMIETECASYREMRDFLKTNHEARFAL